MWQPLTSDKLYASCRESLLDIAHALTVMETQPLPAIQLCEHALLYAYIGLYEPIHDWHKKSLLCLNASVERLMESRPAHNGLFGGIAGFGWMLQHVINIISSSEDAGSENTSDEDDPFTDLDTLIVKLLNPNNALLTPYDLIGGFVGLGVYWLERLPSHKATNGISRTLDALERTSTETTVGKTWFTPKSLVPGQQLERAPSGYYNLGVAHGVPGVISFLAQAATQSFDSDVRTRASTMLCGSMRWLLAQKRSGFQSVYSSWTIPGQDCGNSRTAWCYGDLGIAAILRFVGERTGNPEWISEARALMSRTVHRNLDIGIMDAGLCHGALGVAHIFNRSYHTYQEEIYRTAALMWVQKGLSFRKPGSGIAGYYAWNISSLPREEANVSLLSGVVGIALVLLSFIAPVEPRWDRLMLMSGID